MQDQQQNRNWVYQLPDGTIADNMEIARTKLGLGAQGFRALVRKGIVKKVNNQSKTSGYEREENNS